MRLVGARDDHQPGRVLVEPVDDPRAAGSSPPPSRSPSTSTSVGPRCPGAGWTTSPAGLSTTASQSSTWTTRGRCAGCRRVGSAPSLAARPTTSDHRPDGDRDVGEVEGRPQRRVDEVGDGVDRARGRRGCRARHRRAGRRRATGRAARGRGRTRPARAASAATVTTQHQAPRRRRASRRRCPLLVTWSSWKPSTRSTALDRCASVETTIAFVTWSRQNDDAAHSEQRPPPGARTTCSPADRADDHDLDDVQDEDRQDRAEVEREAAAAERRDHAAEEVEVGVGDLLDEARRRARR